MDRHQSDQLAIMQLMARYYQAIDAYDFEGWAGCFAEGGRFEGAYEAYEVPTDLERFRTDTMKLTPEWPGLRHQATNPCIVLDDDRATAESNFLMTSVNPSNAEPTITVVMAGRYLDQLTRTGEGWRFMVRRSCPDTADRSS